ncbi:PP2C family protein-serine/threonine phosphatase [Actinoallomurus acaciae]|uniref:PP2C family protein-serine/threonine phosphatase n=1 Tax=Actinoallomurus acaciae TaxID=502577 RepID=A0ABV5Y927_9ACTN
MYPIAPHATSADALTFDYAAASDTGQIRTINEDSGYASPRLLAVADGMGGRAAGEIASSTVISSLASADTDVPVSALTRVLGEGVSRANEAIARRVAADPALTGMGTTLTAMLRSGSHLALAHIGDCRAYLLHDCCLEQLTEDHTFERLLSTEFGHPARHGKRLIRVLDGEIDQIPDLSLHLALPGNRYLLCSDGLTGPVAPEMLLAVLATSPDPRHAVARLMEQANRYGGPGNITVIVADAIEDDGVPPVSPLPTLVGSAGR